MDPQPSRRHRLALAMTAGIVLIAVGLRALEAGRKSLWLDEFHTVAVARGEDLGRVTELLRHDFHAPLFFFLVHPFSEADPHTLRWIAILFSLASLPPLLGLLRAAGVTAWGHVPALTAWAALPYRLQYGAELRPYSLLELSCITMAWAAFTSRSSARMRFVVFAAATAVGLYTHYLAALTVLAIGAIRLFAGHAGLLPLKRLVLAGTVGVAAFLPWVLTVESWIFTDPGVMWRHEVLPDEPAVSTRGGPTVGDLLPDVASIPPRTLIPSLSGLGPRVEPIVSACLALLAAVVLGAVVGRLRARARGQAVGGNGVITAAVLAGALAIFLAAGLCVKLWQRVPMQYFVVGAWAWPLVFAACPDSFGTGRWRSRAAVILCVAAVIGGLGHALGAPREDVRRGVAVAREIGGDDAIFSAMLRQPMHYPHTIPYGIYAPHLVPTEPGHIPAVDEPGGRRKVVVLVRSVPFDPEDPRWTGIVTGRSLRETREVDRSIRVLVFDAP